MSSEFEKLLASKLISYQEIDWDEDKVVFRVMSDGDFSDAEEAKAWGTTLANVASKIVNKLMLKYNKSSSKATLPQLYETIQTSFAKNISLEIRDLSDNEDK